MAGFNEILVGRFNRALQKLLSIKGGPPVSSIAPDWMAVLTDDLTAADIRYLLSWQRFGSHVSLGAGGVGNQSKFQLRNPSGSGIIAVVDKLTLVNAGGFASQSLSLRMRHPYDANPPVGDYPTLQGVLGHGYDGRGPQQPTSIPSSDANAVANDIGVQIYVSIVLNSTDLQVYDYIVTANQEIVITPGNALVLSNDATNQGFQFGIAWRERIFEESERF